jgi:hypothetical protein
MEEKLFDLVGLGVPFYLGAATYAVFAWLDNNASDEATQVISSWLHGRSRNKPDLGNLIISAFDRVYTSPLLSFRAFRRSAVISIVVWLLLNLVSIIGQLAQMYNLSLKGIGHLDKPLITVTIAMLLVVAVLSDYLSLFFVRRFLKLAQTRPIIASVMSSTSGLVVVAVCLLLLYIAVLLATYWLNPHVLFHGALDQNSIINLLESLQFNLSYISTTVLKSAFIVHLWLPLFALSSLVVRLVYLILRAVEWAEWLLKQGDAHPLKAIGIVATIIVFGSAMLVKEAWTVL